MRERAGAGHWALLVVLTLALAGCEELVNVDKSEEDLVRERVDFILSAVQTVGGTTSDKLQAAMCRWWNDKIHLKDLGEMESAMDKFEAWQREAGIYPRLQSYEILELRPEQEGSDTFLVLTKINGGYRWLVVPPKAPISWASSE